MSLPHVKTSLGNVRPHTLKVAEEITHRWEIFYLWGQGPSGHHAAGRALDVMTLTANQGALRTRMGNEIAAYLQDNADRLGILYIIWRQRIWNDSRADDRSRTSWSQWRRMADRGSPTENHMDHVHVSFRANPRPYRAPDGTAPPSGGGGDLLERGDTGPRVRELQELLNAHGANLKVDGIYGPKTEAAVTAYQRANGLMVDGIAGSQTLGHLKEDDMQLNELMGYDKIKKPWNPDENGDYEYAIESIWDNAWKAHRHAREMHVQIAGMSAAMKAIAESKGMNGDQVDGIVRTAVRGELDAFEAALGEAEVVLRTGEDN